MDPQLLRDSIRIRSAKERAYQYRGLSSRGRRGKDITDIFNQIGREYRKAGLVTDMEVHPNHDIDAYFRFAQNPSRMIHLRGYPGLSSDENMRVSARILNYGKVMRIREEGIAIGSEHKAVVDGTPIVAQQKVPYKSEALRILLTENFGKVFPQLID